MLFIKLTSRPFLQGQFF